MVAGTSCRPLHHMHHHDGFQIVQATDGALAQLVATPATDYLLLDANWLRY